MLKLSISFIFCLLYWCVSLFYYAFRKRNAESMWYSTQRTIFFSFFNILLQLLYCVICLNENRKVNNEKVEPYFWVHSSSSLLLFIIGIVAVVSIISKRKLFQLHFVFALSNVDNSIFIYFFIISFLSSFCHFIWLGNENWSIFQ